MKKTPLIFTLVKEQSMFLMVIIALMAFLVCLSFGISFGIGTAITKWNRNWDLMATVQVMPGGDVAAAQKIIDSSRGRLSAANKIPVESVRDMMRPWIAGTDALTNYLPDMWEIKFKNKSDIAPFAESIRATGARFITHANATRDASNAGYRIILIAAFLLAAVAAAIVLSVSYIARNIAMIHARELEILTQVGARDAFVVRQLQRIIARLALPATFGGALIAAIILLVIIGMAHGTRVGLMSGFGIGIIGWIIILLIPILITTIAVIIARRTVLKILGEKK